MTYDDVSKILAENRFNEGIRNIRTLTKDNVKLILAFSERTTDIKEFYVSVGVKNRYSTLYSIIIEESDKNKLGEKLPIVIEKLINTASKFTYEMESEFEQLLKSDLIKSWS